MNKQLTASLVTGLYMTGDIGNILEGLRLTATGFPPGQYRDGFLAALAALAASTGNAVLDADYVVIESVPHNAITLRNGRTS